MVSSIAYNLCYYGVIRVIFYTVALRVHNVLVLPFKNRRERGGSLTESKQVCEEKIYKNHLFSLYLAQ